MKRNNWTTVKESKHLIELGVDVKTHDMYHEKIAHGLVEPFEWETFVGQNAAIMDDLFSYRNGYTLPCWSLGALIDLMKPIDGNTYSITGTLDGSAFVQFEDVTIFAAQEKTTFESVYEMVCWLLESNYISNANENF